MVPWCSGYHYCTTSFNKAWTQVLRRFKSCWRWVGNLGWWGSLTMVPARNKAERLSSVNHTTKTIQFIIGLNVFCVKSITSENLYCKIFKWIKFITYIIFIKTFNQYCILRDFFHVKLSRSYQVTEVSKTYLQIDVIKKDLIILQDITGNVKFFSFSS